MRDGKEVIVLAESDERVRDAIKVFLEELHYEVAAVGDGRAALQYLEENPYDTDLVLCALDLPVIGSMEMLKVLKLSQDTKDIPVLVRIPIERETEVAKVMDNGAEDIIFLPFDDRVLANRIRNILVSKRRPACKNVMEDAVVRELDNYVDSLGMCKCRQCRKDAQALALNRLKPRYVSSEKGKILAAMDRMSSDYLPDILRALTESAEIVKKNPRH